MNYDKAPFPWFGGKSRAAETVWAALGDVPHYVEPFAGSMAVLLGRPHPANRAYYSETVNDLDGLVVNAWRAIQWFPEEVAHAASWPVSEADKQARQIAVLKWRDERVLDLLAGSAEWCDPVMAGWWLYGVACQIGAFAGRSAWTVDPVSGRIFKQPLGETREPGVSRKLPHLSDDGQGTNHAGLREPGVFRDRPHLANNGQGTNHASLREPGVRRNRPHLSDNGQGTNRPNLREPGVTRLDQLANNPPPNWGTHYHDHTMPKLIEWMRHLSARLRHVRIVNGDWTRVVTSGAAWTLPVRQGKGPAGIFLDPPYDNNERSNGLYGHDDGTVAADCRHWALEHGDDPKWRIVLAGFDTEHDEMVSRGWREVEWFTPGFLSGGMGNTGRSDGHDGHQMNRERLWLSPHCLNQTEQHTQLELLQ